MTEANILRSGPDDPAPRVIPRDEPVVHMVIAGRVRDIDASIAPLVQALNDAGITTVASCLGHSYQPGNIILADGRELIIAPDYETARKIESHFPGINGEPPRALTPADRIE